MVKTSGPLFYWNCVHLRDAKGEHPYYFQESLSAEDFRTLRTRYTEEQQIEIVEGLQAGETVYQVAKRLSFLPLPVTIFSIVYRMAFPMNVPATQDKWIPYSRQQFESMAEMLRCTYKEGKKCPSDLQPELVAAIGEMFLRARVEPLEMDVEVDATESEDTFDHWGESTDASPLFMPPQPELPADSLREVLRRLDKIEQALSPTTPALPLVEAVFALDVAIPRVSVPAMPYSESVFFFR